ncbi:MAG: ROK family protein [Lentisphaeria bacterium]|nr:ROK family protein [Lentisphaeria bacterium]
MKYVLGIDIGGTKIAVCVANENGEILASGRFPSTKTYAEALAKIPALAQELLASKGMAMKDVSACGISAPGPLDVPNGMLLRSPNMSWGDQLPIQKDLTEALGVSAILENDANAGALAEWFFGCGKGKKDLIYLTMSTGVGGGVVAGGHLIQGCAGNAGELGHIVLDINGYPCNCGLRGCFEAYTGGRAIQQRMQAALKDHPEHAFFRLECVDGKVENLDFRALLEGVRAKIPLALEWWDEYCLRMAQGLAAIVTSFNPEIVVLGTTAYHAGSLLMDPLMKLLPRFLWKEFYNTVTIRTSALGLRIGELAGVSVAFNSLYEKGLWKPAEA